MLGAGNMSRYFLSPDQFAVHHPHWAAHITWNYSQKIYKGIYSLRVPESVRTAHGLIYAQGKEAWDFEKVRQFLPHCHLRMAVYILQRKKDRKQANRQAD